MHRHGRRHLRMWLVVAGNEVTGVLVLTLAPHLQRPILHRFVRPEEIQTAFRTGTISDLDTSALRARRHLDGDLVAVVVVLCRFHSFTGVDPDGAELEAD